MMGLQGAKYYHGALLILAMDLAFIYNAITPGGFWRNLYFLCIPLILLNLYRAVKANDPKDFEPLLKMLALTTLLFTLLFGVGQLYS